MALADVGEAIEWGEARRLVERLSSDPSSHLCAALNDWTHPFGYDLAVLADLFDLTFAIHAKRGKAQTHPIRPWSQKKREKFGDTGGRSRAEVEAILAQMAAGTLFE